MAGFILSEALASPWPLNGHLPLCLPLHSSVFRIFSSFRDISHFYLWPTLMTSF